ncbi:MAG TPA: response regulator [Crinalium sp.]
MTVLKLASATNILVVDDTPDNLRLLAKILETQQYTVRKSLNGKMALQAAHRDPPDLILLDINMPEMNGYDVCQHLKASNVTAHIPIIFISALDQINDKIRAFEIGGQDYITKPFQELEVLARIKNQLLIQQQKQQLAQKNQELEQEIQERHLAEAEVRRLNANLEHEVHVRTLELQQALKFESTLKRISDKVRDSLDQHQILQNAVEELAIALEVPYCDAVLHSPDRRSSVCYQYMASGLTTAQGKRLYMADAPEIYTQLQEQQICFSFCPLQPLPINHPSAVLACPIFDDQVEQAGILGDLWVFKDASASVSDMEIHLVQQVANQCAIALRQAKLYEAAQAQVRELERLNQLKDDFLSTISHELRTPIASMKMILKVLTTVTNQGSSFIEAIEKSSAQNDQVVRYFRVLQEECDRELALVEDLLILQHIEAGTYATQPTPINPQNWIPHVVEPFELRAQSQQQTLQVNLDPNLTSVRLDSRSVARVLTELLNNACKYTPAGGTISISARIVQDTAGCSSAHFLQLTITNTGVAIAPEELPRLFDKFYRIPNHDPWKYGGTGLGLALVKRLVEQMEGTIEVESSSDQICFTVRLNVGSA